MLHKQQRLNTKAFEEHFKTGKRYHSPNLQLIHLPAFEFHGAVVVGKKVYKQAVKRNHLRRQLYGVLYRAAKAGLINGTFMMIVKPSAKQVERKAILKEAHDLLTSERRFRHTT